MPPTPAIALLDIYQEKQQLIITQKPVRNKKQLLIAALFITTKNWKQTRYFSVSEWLN